MGFKVGDKVRQNDARGTYRSVVPGLIGTIVEIEEDEVILYPIQVNFPTVDDGLWPFREVELDLVEEENA